MVEYFSGSDASVLSCLRSTSAILTRETLSTKTDLASGCRFLGWAPFAITHTRL
jgi:hypothetical protein